MSAAQQTEPSAPRTLLAEAWNTLSRVDVGDHIETAEVKKDGRTVYTYQYLSWSWCWATLMKYYPESYFQFMPPDVYPDGTMMINVEVNIVDGERVATRHMHLPVMNQGNTAITNPNARQISDSRMRALVKCLALFGLGLDLWAGSDIPVGSASDPIDADQLELISGLFSRLDEVSQKSFKIWADVDDVAALPKSRYKSARQMLERKLQAQGGKP